LNGIIESSSQKYLKRIDKKLGFFDDLGFRHEMRKRRIEREESELAVAAGQYICPICLRKGYLFPNLDEAKLGLYVIHILWKKKEVKWSVSDQFFTYYLPIKKLKITVMC